MNFNKLKKLIYSDLFLPLILLVIFYIPNFFQRFFEVDEGVYAAIAKAIFNGSLLYVDVWDHKPPLTYLFYSPVALLGVSTGMLIIRVVTFLIAVINLLVLKKILVKLNLTKRFRIVLMIIAAFLLATPIFEGNFVNSEVLFLPVTLIFIYRILCNKFGYIEGILMFIAFFVKFQAFAEIAFLLFVVTVIHFKNKRNVPIRDLAKIFLGFSALLIISVVIFAISGNLKEAFFAIITMNFGYVDQYNYLISIGTFEVSRKVIILLFFTLVFAAVFVKYFKFNKKFRISNQLFFVINLFLIELFLVLYPERNYGHYLQQFIPGIIFSLIPLHFVFKKSKSDLLKIVTPFIYIISLVIFLMTFTTAGLKQDTEVTGFPLFGYYSSFITNTSDPVQRPYFSELNNGETAAKYFKDKYGKYKSFYMYTKDTWVFTLSNLQYKNKYFLYSQMYFTPQIFEAEKINILSSEVIFKEEELLIQKKLDQQIKDNYILMEKYLGYDIYVKKDLL